MIRNIKPGWEKSIDHKIQTERTEALKLFTLCGGRRQGNKSYHILLNPEL